MWHVLSKYNREGNATFSERPTTTGRGDGVALETMRVLLERDGGLIHATSRSHKSTLRYAAGAAFKQADWKRMCNYLVEKGADPNYSRAAGMLRDRIAQHTG